MDGALILGSTVDRIIGVGDVSTMSRDRDNVHWFVPTAGSAATFDVRTHCLEVEAHG